MKAILFLIFYLVTIYAHFNNSVKLFNNTNQRSLFGTGDDVLLYDGPISELDIGNKIYFKNGYFSIIGYNTTFSEVNKYNYYYFLFDSNGHRLVDYVPIFEDILFERDKYDEILNILEINNILLVVMKASINNIQGVYYSTINLLGEYLQEPTFITNLESKKKWTFEDSTILTNGLIPNLYSYIWETTGDIKSRHEDLFGITFNSDLSLYGSDYAGVTSYISCENCQSVPNVWPGDKLLTKISINPLSNGRSVIHFEKNFPAHSLGKKLLDENFYGEVVKENNYDLLSAIVTDNYIFEFGRVITRVLYGITLFFGPAEMKVYDTNGEYIDIFDYSEFPFVNIENNYKIDDNNYLLIHNSDKEDFDFSFTVQGNEYNFYFKGGSQSSSKYKYYHNYDKMYNNVYFDLFTKSNNRRYLSRLDYSNDINTPLKLYTPQPSTEPDYSITGNAVPTQVPTKAPTQVPTKAPTQSPTKAPTLAPTHYSSVVSDTSHPTLTPTQGYLDSENGDLPSNDNDEVHDEESPGINPDEDQDEGSPGINPDEDQEETDDSEKVIIVEKKDNSLVIVLIIVLVVLCLAISFIAYMCTRKTSCTGECSNDSKIKVSVNGKDPSSIDIDLLSKDSSRV